MGNPILGRDFINLRDFTPEQFRYLLDLAHELKAEKRAGVDQRRFVNKDVIAQFEWGSTRTRCAFETSCHDLGLGFTYLSNSHVGFQETVKDTIRVFNEMYDAIVWRAQGTETFMYQIAEYADIPVINALTTEDHPTQMLADAMTLEDALASRAPFERILPWIPRKTTFARGLTFWAAACSSPDR